MNLLDSIRGSGDKKRASEYPRARVRGEYQTDENTGEHTVFKKTVQKNTDLLEVKDKLYDSNILLVELGEEIQPKRDRVLSQIEETVRDINGDVVLHEDNKVIAVPDGISINRS